MTAYNTQCDSSWSGHDLWKSVTGELGAATRTGLADFLSISGHFFECGSEFHRGKDNNLSAR